MESAQYHYTAALLAWQIELGADEAICEGPVNCYELPDTLAKPRTAQQPPPAMTAAAGEAQASPRMDAGHAASVLAAQAFDLESLRQAVAEFEPCELKRGARNTLFGAGVAGARVMVMADAPNRNDDRLGAFFAGAEGQLFDRMFAAIDLERTGGAAAVYVSYVMPWRPPQDRSLKPEELAMIKPFVTRHIALVDPDVVVLTGNAACQLLLGKRGLTRLRGRWNTYEGRPVMVMQPPEHLMRNPLAKREAWADLLEIKARLSHEKGAPHEPN